MPRACTLHPGAAVEFRCSGCGELLCADCVEAGHRLFFCRRCGERALPLAAGAPATTTARRARVARDGAASYGYAEALAYPFRGGGATLFWVLLVLSWALDLAGRVPGLAIVGWAVGALFGALVALLMPRFLFDVAAATARGGDELPDWPDFDPWELLGSALLFVAIALLCLAPAALLLRVTGCLAELAAGDLGSCLLALATGAVAAVALWVPAFGASAVYRTPWLFFRVDLHLRAVATAPGDYLAAVALVAGLQVVALVLRLAVTFLPLVGTVVGTAVGLYALFLGAHLAGVWFRRHPGELAAVYT